MNSDGYKPFLQHLSTIMSDPISTMYHVKFEKNFSIPSSAPVTEMLTIYFDSSYDNSQFDPKWKEFAEVLQNNATGFFSVASGWTLDEVEHNSLEGKKGKALVAAIGWASVQAHMDYRETQAFKDSIHLLKEGPKAIEMHHVEFKAF